MQLKYLFAVEFTDGSYFYQDKSDKSTIDPKRSQFYDLLQIKKPMRRAWLAGLDENEHSVGVDLWTGVFTINDFPIQIDQNPLPNMQRELVFFREHQHDANVTYETKSKKVTKMEEGEHRVKYFIGWRVTINNKAYQQIIGVV